MFIYFCHSQYSILQIKKYTKYIQSTNNPSGTCIVRYTRKFSTREIVSILARTPTQNTTQRYDFIWIYAERNLIQRIYIPAYAFVSVSLSFFFFYLNLFIEIFHLLIEIHSSDTNNRFISLALLTCMHINIYICMYTYWSDCITLNKRKRFETIQWQRIKNAATYKISRRTYAEQEKNANGTV